MRAGPSWGLSLVAVLCSGCGHQEPLPHPPQKSVFTEITDVVGLDFASRPGDVGAFLTPEITGFGAALFDYDADGDLDLYLLQGASLLPPHPATPAINRLYRQETDGTLKDVTEVSGLGDAGYAMGVAVGDYDGDGRVDVFVSNHGPDVLFRNAGQGRFVDVTVEAGVSGEGWSSSTVFCDYDRDGLLDLYVVRYVRFDPSKQCRTESGLPDYCGPAEFPGVPDLLFHNQGGGRFLDVSAEAGISRVSGPGLGVVCRDFDGDDRPDFYVANDGAANNLWVNLGDGSFRDEATIRGVALNAMGLPEAGMGVIAEDLDGDLDLDVFLTHLEGETNTLYRNDGEVGFADSSAGSGAANPSLIRTGFGVAPLDHDNDGDLDLVIANGRVERDAPVEGAGLGDPWDAYAEPNLLLRNKGGGSFEDASAAAGLFASRIEISRALAVGDLDGDGDRDVLLTNTASPARVYRNDTADRGGWLAVHALARQGGHDVPGTRVTLEVGGAEILRIADPGYGYLSSSDPRAHFGVGTAPEIQRLTVSWPDGLRQVFIRPPLDRSLRVARLRAGPQ